MFMDRDNEGLNPQRQAKITLMTSGKCAGIIPHMSENELLQRITARLESLGLSENAACEAAGIDRGTIKDLRTNKRSSLTLRTLSKLAVPLQTSAAWLAGSDETTILLGDEAETHRPPYPVRASAAVVSGEIYRASAQGIIPEVDAAAGAGDGQVGEVVQIQSGGIQSGHKVVAEWQVPPDITRHMMGVDPRQILILPVRGDLMEPTLRNGDRIIVDLTDASPNDGGIYVIDEGFGPMVKRIRPVAGTEPLMVEIISDNQFVGRYQLLAEQVRVIGRARGRWSAI